MAVRERLKAVVTRAAKSPVVARVRSLAAKGTFVTTPLKRATGATKKRASKRAATKTAPKATSAAKRGSASRTATTRSRSTATAGKPVGKRERIDTTPGKPGGSRYVRRDAEGHFTKDQVDVGRSLAADRRSKAKTKATRGMKDRGD
jgi:hypothetical protein